MHPKKREPYLVYCKLPEQEQWSAIVLGFDSLEQAKAKCDTLSSEGLDALVNENGLRVERMVYERSGNRSGRPISRLPRESPYR